MAIDCQVENVGGWLAHEIHCVGWSLPTCQLSNGSTSLRFAVKIHIETVPRGRMIARVGQTPNVPVHIGSRKPRQEVPAEQKMIEPQSCVPSHRFRKLLQKV